MMICGSVIPCESHDMMTLLITELTNDNLRYSSVSGDSLRRLLKTHLFTLY